MEKKTKERESNIELLKIMCMIFIILHHLIYHNYLFAFQGDNNTIAWVLSSGAKISVNCFIIILGYFALDSKFNTKRIISLILELLFYEVIFYFLFNIRNLNLVDFYKNLDQYWFINGYLVIYAISPIMKIYLKKTPKLLQIILFFILAIYVIVNRADISFFIWFILLFFIGAYIYKINTRGFNICVMIMAFIYTYFLIIKTKNGYELTNILVLIDSIIVFLIFLKLNIKKSKIINDIAKYTTGVYLIHDNFYVRSNIVKNSLYMTEMYVANSFFIYTIIVSILIYGICIILDIIRSWIFKKMLFKNKKLNEMYEKIDNFINKKVEKTNDL